MAGFDIAQWWSNDLTLAANGDLQAVSGLNRDNQRIVRRLCTNGTKTGSGVFDWAFHTDYGGSAPWYVGQTTPQIILEGLVREQLYMEECVSHAPEPAITSAAYPIGLLTISVKYADLASGNPRDLEFNIKK